MVNECFSGILQPGNQYGGAAKDAPKQREVGVKKVLTFCGSLAFLIGVSGGANADAIQDFGTISVPGFVNDGVNDGKTRADAMILDHFEDQYLFAVSPSANIDELTSVINAGDPEINLNTFVVELWESDTAGSANETTLLATGVQRAAPSTDIFDLFFAGLVPSVQYFINVEYDLLATSSNYTELINLSWAPLPLPLAAVLFLSALAGLVGFSRIRRRRVVTERLLGPEARQ